MSTEVLATAGAIAAGTGITLAQLTDVMDAGEKISRLSATAILGVALVLCLCLLFYCVRTGVSKLVAIIEKCEASIAKNETTLQRVATAIEKCEGKK